MRFHIWHITIAVTIVLAVVLIATSCGKYGSPKVPRPKIPEAIPGGEVILACGQIELVFTLPETYKDGSRLQKIYGVRIYRAYKPYEPPKKAAKKTGLDLNQTLGALFDENLTAATQAPLDKTEMGLRADLNPSASPTVPPGMTPSPTPKPTTLEDIDYTKVQYDKNISLAAYYKTIPMKHRFAKMALIAELRKEELNPHPDYAGKYLFIDDGMPPRDEKLRPIKDFKFKFYPWISYEYYIEVLDHKKRKSENKLIGKKIFGYVPNPPLDLNCALTQSGVLLTWEKARYDCIDNNISHLVKTSLFKSTSLSRFDPKPINIEQAHLDYYLDEKVHDGIVYYYRIKSYIPSPLLESHKSLVKSIRFLDTKPPLSPQNLVASLWQRRISLIWSHPNLTEVSGFNIERSIDGGDYIKLNSELLLRTSYEDNDVVVGHSYFYRVTAVDNAILANESEPSEPVKIDVY